MLTNAIMAALIALTPAGSSPSPGDVVRALFDAFNRQDVAAMLPLYADDVRISSSDFCAPRGKRDVERTYRALFTAYPQIKDHIETLIERKDRVAVSFTARGGSGRDAFAIPIVTVFRIRDGLIVDDDTIFDAGPRPCSR